MDQVITPGDPKKIFELHENLGTGAFGAVYRAKNVETDVIVAVKRIEFQEADEVNDVLKEIQILQACHDDNIVGYFGTYKESDKCYWISMELCGVGSVLSTFHVLKKGVTEDQLAFIMYKVLLGLNYLHSQKRIHRDMKADNVLIKDDGKIKIADFGVSATVARTMDKRNTSIGTPFWMAPEVLQESGYNSKADIWSLGITAIEMIEGNPPLSEFNAMRAMLIIPERDPPTLKKKELYSDGLNDFLSKCLVKNQEERWSAKQLLEHPWIKEKGAKLDESVLASRIKDVAEGRAKIKADKEKLAQKLGLGNSNKPSLPGAKYLPSGGSGAAPPAPTADAQGYKNALAATAGGKKPSDDDEEEEKKERERERGEERRKKSIMFIHLFFVMSVH